MTFIERSETRLRFTTSYHISLYDILKSLGIQSNEKKHVLKYRTIVKNHNITMLQPTLRWDPETRQHTDIKYAKETPCCDLDNLVRFIGYILTTSKLDTESILVRFGLSPSILDVSYTPRTEKEIMNGIKLALPWHCCTQFAIGMYRIDLYLPDFKIAVECDEFNHTQYDRLDDERRQTFITQQLACRWVRFDPYTDEFCTFALIRRILKFVPITYGLHPLLTPVADDMTPVVNVDQLVS